MRITRLDCGATGFPSGVCEPLERCNYLDLTQGQYWRNKGEVGENKGLIRRMGKEFD